MIQIQIISTQDELQAYFNQSVENALKNLGFPGSVAAKGPEEKPITVKELQEFLGVTEATIIRWRKKGKIPFMQLGSRILFNRSAVLTALESKKKG